MRFIGRPSTVPDRGWRSTRLSLFLVDRLSKVDRTSDPREPWSERPAREDAQPERFRITTASRRESNEEAQEKDSPHFTDSSAALYTDSRWADVRFC
jgi:hypothetical protein